MNFKTYLNQYGLMIFDFNKSYSIMFNGLYLKLNNKNVDLNEIDSILFYEMAYRDLKHS